ncbi:hypothetical protein [Knoellia aerolata]|uniref:hypothetical protein n=1 Tax=Knoellia aerolata TaxID=442954 RepID=UPI0012ED248F|nr:hypothetical protein [Knoellia aerolata]
MGAQPDLRLTWSFLSALAALWASHPGTYKVRDEADDLIPALAQMSIKALAAEVRESVSAADQRVAIKGELALPGGATSPVTVRDIANKIVHGSPDRVEVADGDIRLYFVNSPNEAGSGRWVELWFSAPSFISAMYPILHIKPHDSPRRDTAVRDFIAQLGVGRFLPSRVGGLDGP